MEGSMITFTVKNIPPDLYKKLKESAEINRRSINSEIIVCIEKSVESQAIDSDMLLHKARKLRSHTANHPITHQELTQIKDIGRP
jgi:antitoxin FitA